MEELASPFARQPAADAVRFFDSHEGRRDRQQNAAASRPVFKTAAAFCAEYQPLAYVVEPIIRTSSVYTLTAKTGAGKTALAVILCLAVATGRSDLLGMEVEQGRVAYLAFENPDDVRMRLMTAAFLLDVDLQDIAEQYVILDVRAKPQEIVAELREMTKHGHFALVILDTFAAAFDGRDINDNVEAGEFLRRLRPVTQIDGLPALLIPAHPTKNAADDNLVPYGGGAILNEVDGNLTLAKRSDTGNTVLHWQGKFRGLEFQPALFRFEIVASPDVIDRKGRQVQIPVLKPTTEDNVEAREADAVDRTLAILRAIDSNTKMTVRQIADATGVSKSAVDRHLARLSKVEKLIEPDLKGAWRLTNLGLKKFNEVNDL